MVLVTLIAIVTTISVVGYVALNGACPNPTGQSGLSIVEAPHAMWDEQAFLTMDVDQPVLTTTVTPMFVQDAEGYGPVYLLNGVTDSGYWYQLGIAFNWGAGDGYAAGAEVIVSVFSPTDSSVPVYNMLTAVSVASDDPVTLSMSLLGGCATLSMNDPITHASVQGNYNLEQANRFVPSSPGNSSDTYFSGLMTEWWHVSQYYGPSGNGTYTLPAHTGSFVGLGIDEWNPVTGQTLFANSTRGNLALPQSWTLSFQNVSEAVNQSAFVTR